MLKITVQHDTLIQTPALCGEAKYKDAEIIYSLQHKKILELASAAGAIYRMDGTVLINRDIFEEYLERFHEPSTLKSEEEPV